MMHATLMNFGTNTRVVNDMNNAAVSIGIGQIVETDIHDVHYGMIRRCIATETLLVVPKDTKPTLRLQSIMRVIKGMESEPYDGLLVEYFKVIPQGEDVKLRPTRTEMLLQLKEHARFEVATMLKLQSKVIIREEGDPTTRNRKQPKTVIVPPEESKNPKVVESPDRKDKAPRQAASRGKGKPKPTPQSLKPKVKRERL